MCDPKTWDKEGQGPDWHLYLAKMCIVDKIPKHALLHIEHARLLLKNANK